LIYSSGKKLGECEKFMIWLTTKSGDKERCK
jgi:hypothetical protein